MALGYVIRTHVFLLVFIYPILALAIGHRAGGTLGLFKRRQFSRSMPLAYSWYSPNHAAAEQFTLIRSQILVST